MHVLVDCCSVLTNKFGLQSSQLSPVSRDQYLHSMLPQLYQYSLSSEGSSLPSGLGRQLKVLREFFDLANTPTALAHDKDVEV
jgi:hypothetical protein